MGVDFLFGDAQGQKRSSKSSFLHFNTTPTFVKLTIEDDRLSLDFASFRFQLVADIFHHLGGKFEARESNN